MEHVDPNFCESLAANDFSHTFDEFDGCYLGFAAKNLPHHGFIGHVEWDILHCATFIVLQNLSCLE